MTKPKRKLTLKEDRFTTITAQTLNPTQAVREVYNVGGKGGSKTKVQKENTTRQIAHKNLEKDYIKKSIVEKIDALMLGNKSIEKIHKRNILQNNISASNQALDMYYKMRGDYAPEKKMNLNINITKDNIDNRIEEINKELNGL